MHSHRPAVLYLILNYISCTYVALFYFSGGQHGTVQPFSDEDASIETLSHCSSFSDTTSVADDGRFMSVPCVLLSLCTHASAQAACIQPVFTTSYHVFFFYFRWRGQ